MRRRSSGSRGARPSAVALGTHREAAAQYERTVRYAGGLPLEEQAEILERLAYESYVTSRFDAALEGPRRRPSELPATRAR